MYPDSDPPDLPIRQVAESMGVHVNTVKRLILHGHLAGYRIGSRGDLRVRQADLEAFRRRNRVTGGRTVPR